MSDIEVATTITVVVALCEFVLLVWMVHKAKREYPNGEREALAEKVTEDFVRLNKFLCKFLCASCIGLLTLWVVILCVVKLTNLMF